MIPTTTRMMGGNPDRLANRNADFKEAYEILKAAHAGGEAYLDVNQQGYCVARKLSGAGAEFGEDELSSITIRDRIQKQAPIADVPDADDQAVHNTTHTAKLY